MNEAMKALSPKLAWGRGLGEGATSKLALKLMHGCAFAVLLLLSVSSASADELRHTEGGATTLWFNRGAIAPLGIELARAEGDSGRGDVGSDYLEQRYAVDDGAALSFLASRGVFSRLAASAARHRGGPVLRVRGTEVDLRGFRIEQRGAARVGLSLVDAAGTVWFRLDHAHQYLDGGTFSFRHLDLRIAPALAAALGRPEWDGMLVGGAQVESDTTLPALRTEAAAVCTAQWPAPGLQPDVRIVRLAQNWEEREPDGINGYRCGRDDGQGGHTRVCTQDSLDGVVVLSPDASLRNMGNASVAWHPKFTAPSPPYDNDQHPYLVWNLYRQDADGSIRQISTSGVKHAFHTINAACGCEGGEVLYPGCEDTYGGFSNDYLFALAPRAELEPRTALWGRCGSVFDKDCDGRSDPDGGELPDDAYNPVKRMAVRESEISPARNPGARWFVEYWYVVRDQAERYAAIGLTQIEPRKERGQGADPTAWIWRFDAGAFRNGAMVEAWATPGAGVNGTELARFESPGGGGTLGTRATDLGGGLWRYDYLLFNLDFALVSTQGAGATLRMLSNRGLGELSLPVAADVEVTRADSELNDLGAQRHWSNARASGRLAFRAGLDAPTLDWGRSLRVSFVANVAPLRARVVVRDANGNVVATPFALVPAVEPVVRRTSGR